MLRSQVPSLQQLLSQLPVYSHKDKAATSKVLGLVLDRWAAGMSLHKHIHFYYQHAKPLCIQFSLDDVSHLQAQWLCQHICNRIEIVSL